jgi:GSCFA family.
MDFRTRILIPKSDISIDHSTKAMLFGSCFSENIGQKLLRYKFQVEVNPFGILYNPLSVSTSIIRLLSAKSFSEAELVFNNGMYHSFMHHGVFSAVDKHACLQNISERFERAAAFIRKTDLYLLTFGTAYAYKLKESGRIVGNCHKFPADKFHRFRLSVEEIVEEWGGVIGVLATINPQAKLLFTVSPIRHWKDGAHENQISKSILHLAVDALQNRFPDIVYYFPAYEVMIDELRDYRFYDEDMMHPSSSAVEYIWSRFSETFFTDETHHVNEEWVPIRKALDHRPLHPETDAYRTFLEQTAQKMDAFAHKHPDISCEEERLLLSSLWKDSDRS